MYVYLYIYIYTYVCMYVCMCIYIYIYILCISYDMQYNMRYDTVLYYVILHRRRRRRHSCRHRGVRRRPTPGLVTHFFSVVKIPKRNPRKILNTKITIQSINHINKGILGRLACARASFSKAPQGNERGAVGSKNPPAC